MLAHVSISECRTNSQHKFDNSSFESVEDFKYFGKTLTNQKSVGEEIKSRIKSGNVCCFSVENLLSYSLLYKNLKIKIYRTLLFSRCFIWV